MKKIMKISVVLAVAMLISVMAVATVSATSDLKSEKTNNGITIDSKEKKVASYKITWNANGGKIGSKKTKVTSVKRGSKIKKLVASPKRSGFSFKGWFTKKNGGKKITKNTKPTKSISYFAQWAKKSTSSKLVGTWWYSTHSLYDSSNSFAGQTGIHNDESMYYTFKSDGTFVFTLLSSRWGKSNKTGNYKVSNDKITFTNVVKITYSGNKFDCPNLVFGYHTGKQGASQYLKIAGWITSKPAINFIPSSHGVPFIKM